MTCADYDYFATALYISTEDGAYSASQMGFAYSFRKGHNGEYWKAGTEVAVSKRISSGVVSQQFFFKEMKLFDHSKESITELM